MAVVNICRPAWKGPWVTRRTISPPLCLSSTCTASVPPFLAFREVSLNEFQALGAPVFSLSLSLFPFFSRRLTRASCRKTNYSCTENIAVPHVSKRRRSSNNGRGSVNAKRTGQQHWKMARVTRWTLTTFVRLAFFPSFARNDRESFARCHRFRCATAVPRPLARRDQQLWRRRIDAVYSPISRLRPKESVSRKHATENWSTTVRQLKILFPSITSV